jgi:hypothetical protein
VSKAIEVMSDQYVKVMRLLAENRRIQTELDAAVQVAKGLREELAAAQQTIARQALTIQQRQDSRSSAQARPYEVDGKHLRRAEVRHRL